MPRESADLSEFMQRPGVGEAIRRKGVRYMVWLSGQDATRGQRRQPFLRRRVPAGAGCFGVAWWQNNSEYTASVWDMSELSDMGAMKAAVRGTSVIPALVIPIPIIARTREKACDSLASQCGTTSTSAERPYFQRGLVGQVDPCIVQVGRQVLREQVRSVLGHIAVIDGTVEVPVHVRNPVARPVGGHRNRRTDRLLEAGPGFRQRFTARTQMPDPPPPVSPNTPRVPGECALLTRAV